MPNGEDETTNRVQLFFFNFEFHAKIASNLHVVYFVIAGSAGSLELDAAGTEIVQGRNNAWFGASLTVGDAVTVCIHL